MAVTPRHWPVTHTELAGVGIGLAIAAMLAPLQMYLIALILFGLPHVLWEMNWVRHTYRRSLPTPWWMAFFAILLLQATARLGTWANVVPAEITMAVDALTLALLAFLVAKAVHRHGGPRAWLAAVIAVVIGCGLIVAVDAGSVAGVLLVLAVVHNFTPLALVPPNQRFGKTQARRALALLFTLPWLLAAAILVSGFSSPVSNAMGSVPEGAWMPNETVWLRQHFAAGFAAALSGLVLSQCLHYYCVLRLLPATLKPDVSRKWQTGALAASVALTLYFVYDFTSARKLYSVAAGVHAWLELPLMLLLLSGIALQPSRAKTPFTPPGAPA